MYYSPVYFRYKLYDVPGLAPTWPSYACDTFWPMVIGETGWLGLAAYAGMVVMLFLQICRQKDKGSWIYLAAMILFAYEILETTSALAFSESMAVGSAMLFGLIFAAKAGETEETQSMVSHNQRSRRDGPGAGSAVSHKTKEAVKGMKNGSADLHQAEEAKCMAKNDSADLL